MSGPERATNGAESHFADVFEALAATQPQHPALVCGDRLCTWGELDDRTSRLAAVLSGAGLSLHGTVGILLRNCNEYLETYLAALKVRGVPISINYRYAEDELVSLLHSSACEVLVLGATFADRVLAIRDRVPNLAVLLVVQDDADGTPSPIPDGMLDYESVLAAATPAAPVVRSGDDPLVVYTGGTTGLPKALTYPIRSRLHGRLAEFAGLVGLPDPGTAGFVEAAAGLAQLGASPVGLPASPLMHNAALVTCALPTLLLGGTVVTVPSAGFDAAKVWDAIDRWGVTSMTIVGDAMGRPLLQALAERIRHGTTPGASLRTITSTGMAWNSATKAGLLDHLPQLQLVEVFGATEGLMGLSKWTAQTPVHSSPRFTPVPGLRILREDGSDAPRQEAGNIAFPVDDAVRYRDDPEKTAATFRMLAGRRHAVLGDLGRLLPDGSLEPLGRGGQVVNTGGEKVFPAEVEDIIRGIDGITDCLVVGVPDPDWGQRLVAVVSRTAEAVTADAVRTAVRSRLAGFKVPKEVVFVATVPRFPNGKADLHEAARIADAGTSTPTG